VEAPPAVVVDAHDVCDNLEQAQSALHEALGGSVAPEEGWRLRVFDERRGTHVIVTANLDDAKGNAVAHREIDSTSSDRCAGVISALGVWAALVLDAEVAKVKAHPTTTTPSPLPPPTPSTTVAPAIQAADADAGAPPPQHTGHAIEIGASGMLQSSPLSGFDSALVGGNVFMLFELARSFLIRPALGSEGIIVGGAGSASGGYYETRLDACLRIPGNYTEHRGLLLDACAGGEVGVLDFWVQGIHQTDVIFQVGPTIALRGDLASDLSVEVRGLVGFNVAHTAQETLGLLALRAEVGLTWRLR
jgi:hypothetical protein